MISKDSTHVYVDDKWVKIVHIRSAGSKKTVTGVYSRDLSKMESGEKLDAMIVGFREVGAKNKKVTLSIPSKYVITKNIEVPSLDPKEIEDIVRLQAGRHTPYSKEEIVIGHINLEVMMERYTKTLLYIVSNDNIRKSTDLLLIAGYEIESVHLVSEALSQAAVKALSLTTDSPALGLIYPDKESTDLVIVKNQKPFFIRNIPLGTNQLTNTPEARKAFVDEIKKTFDAFQNDSLGDLPKHFLVMDILGSESLETLADILTLDLQLEVDMALIGDQIGLAGAIQSEVTHHPEVSFLDVIVDGLVGDDLQVDLMPQDLKIRKAFREKAQQIFTGAVLAVLIFFSAVSIFVSKIYFRSSYLNEYRNIFEIKNLEAQKLMALADDTRMMRIFKSKKSRSYSTLVELSEILPEDIYLSEIVLDNDEKISIKGTSNFMSTVFSFVTLFEQSDQFSNVTTDFTKSRKENNKDVSDFGISAALE